MVMDSNDMENNEIDSSVITHSMDESQLLLSGDHDATHLLSTVHFPSCRLVLTIMGFLGFANVYILRVNLSIALVAMLNHTQQPYDNASRNHSENNTADICESSGSTGRTGFGKEDMQSGEFNWDSHLQGTVLAAFFYGYITTQVRVFDITWLLSKGIIYMVRHNVRNTGTNKCVSKTHIRR